MARGNGDAAMAGWIAGLRALAARSERVTETVRTELEQELRANIAAARGPDGTPWPPRLDGEPLGLTDNAAELTVTAQGGKVIATVRGNLARHHRGKARGYRARGIKREVLPSRRNKASMRAVSEACRRAFEQLKGEILG